MGPSNECTRLHSRRPALRHAVHRRLQGRQQSTVIASLRTRLEVRREYVVTRLVYVESHATPSEAIGREKALKEWRRDWKIRLIEQESPDWSDLSQLL